MMRFITSKYFFWIAAVIILLSFETAEANNVILKGHIIDRESGAPIGAKIQFIGADNKKIYCNSNSADGSYQQVLQAGQTYSISVDEHIVVDEALVSIAPGTPYMEIPRDFKVQKIKTGLHLFAIHAFTQEKAELAAEAKTKLKELRDFLMLNAGTTVEITVSSEDTYMKSKKVKEYYTDKNGRKKYKWVRLTAEQNLEALIDSRIEAITEYLKELKLNQRRFTFEKDIKNGNKSKRKRNSIESQILNLKVSVKSYMKL